MSTAETVMMTPDQAKMFREEANFDLQRPLREANVKRLLAEMKAGRFIPGTPIYFATLPDSRMLALNGNHTLEAITRLDPDAEVELTAIYQPVANLQEAAQIYSAMDLHRLRSWTDSLRAYGADKLIDDSTYWTTTIATGLGFMMSGFTVSNDESIMDEAQIAVRHSRELRVQIIRASEGPAKLYVAAASAGPDRKLFKRSAVAGVGIEIMRYQPSAGTEFFTQMAQDDGLRKGDPARALLHYLRNNRSGSGSDRTLHAKAVASAWNAFFARRQIQFVRPGNTIGGVRIDGTPWNGTFDPIDAYMPELRQQPAPKPTLRLAS